MIECKVLHTLEIGLHTQFIGEIIDVKAEESIFIMQGIAYIMKIKPSTFGPMKGDYYAIGEHLGAAFSIGARK